MARVASTALLRVIESKSPKLDPRNRDIWSPHQSKSFSNGMIERKHTDENSDVSNRPRPRVDGGTHTQRLFFHPSVQSGKPKQREGRPTRRSSLGIRS